MVSDNIIFKSTKGYLSFVIVFLFAIISISLIYILYTSHPYNVNDTKALTSETVYANLLDFKHSAVSITRTATKVAVTEYLAELATKSTESGGVDAVKEYIDPSDLKKRVKEAVSTGLMAIQVNGLTMSCDDSGIPYNPVICRDKIHVLLDRKPESLSVHVHFDNLNFKYCYEGVCGTGYIPKTMDISVGVKYPVKEGQT